MKCNLNKLKKIMKAKKRTILVDTPCELFQNFPFYCSKLILSADAPFLPMSEVL